MRRALRRGSFGEEPQSAVADLRRLGDVPHRNRHGAAMPPGMCFGKVVRLQSPQVSGDVHLCRISLGHAPYRPRILLQTRFIRGGLELKIGR